MFKIRRGRANGIDNDDDKELTPPNSIICRYISNTIKSKESIIFFIGRFQR